jgi:hypothetical protein
MLVGLFKVKFALLAANALEASVKANPTTKLFVTVANFIAAPFFFPEKSELVRGGPFTDNARKHLCFAAHRLQCCRRG